MNRLDWRARALAAEAAVERVRALADEWERVGGDNPGAIGLAWSLRAALDGPGFCGDWCGPRGGP